MNFQPMYDRLLVKRAEVPAMTEGGIHIPDAARERAQEGVVLSVGEGRRAADGSLVPMLIKPGDNVMFGKYSGSQIFIDGEEFAILREDEVMGKITEGSLGLDQSLVPAP